MALILDCPSCGKKLKVPDELVGQTVRCSDCAMTFTAARPASPQPPSRRDNDHDDDDRPSRRGRRLMNDGGLEAHRGGLVMSFGIISLVLVLLSGGVYVGGTAVGGVFGVGGLPVTIVGLVLGILAWIWGGSDLSRMNAGYMDPTGRGNTQAGYICGIIGTILNALGLIVGCVAIVLFLIIGATVLSGFCCLMSVASQAQPPPVPNAPRPNPGRRSFQLPPAKIADYLPRPTP